jgi:hypothetical protein
MISFILFFLVSCDDSDVKSNVVKNKIIVELDTCLSNSKNIMDYLPKRIKKHNDLSSYLRLYVDIGDDFYSKMYQNLNIQADIEMSITDMNKTNNESDDIVDVFKGTYKSVKTLKRTLKFTFKTVWAGKDLFKLEENRGQLKSKYSTLVIDSFKFVENAINKYLYYSFVKPYKEELSRIKAHKSIRIMPKGYNRDTDKEVKFKNILEDFIELQKESNDIRKIIVYNDINQRDCSGLIKYQVSSILSFWESEDIDYKNETKLFRNFTHKLVRLKNRLSKANDYLNNNNDDWNQKTIKNCSAIILMYDELIKNEILSLNINEFKQPDWTIFKE